VSQFNAVTVPRVAPFLVSHIVVLAAVVEGEPAVQRVLAASRADGKIPNRSKLTLAEQRTLFGDVRANTNTPAALGAKIEWRLREQPGRPATWLSTGVRRGAGSSTYRRGSTQERSPVR